MWRGNGFGTTLLGFRRTGGHSDPNVGSATKWFTLFFLPFIPLGRLHIRIAKSQKGSGISFHELGRSALHWGEIALTYLTGWIVWPAIFLFPFVTGIGDDTDAFAYIWIGGAAVLAMVLRDRRFKYVPDPGRERRESSLIEITYLLRRAGISGDVTVTGLGYLLAAAVIAADGEVKQEEVAAASLIGGRLFPDFSERELASVLELRDQLPPVDRVGELIRDSLPREGKDALLAYLRAISEIDGASAPAELAQISELQRMWS